jgi:hypothetical protein
VFPRRTNATPCDPFAFIGPPGLFPPKVDAVHVSVAFSWDMREAERLAEEWCSVAPVSIGGPATGMKGGDFTSGMYLSPGHVITSRGCNRHCWFCKVPVREGRIRELPITDGWIVTDDNLLQCSEAHIRAVLAMLRRQSNPAEFRGGLEAAMLKEWFVEELKAIRLESAYFAYDTPDDLSPLQRAGEILRDHGLTGGKHRWFAFVLCGWPEVVRRFLFRECRIKADTFEAANRRMEETCRAGFMPHAMLWRDDSGKFDPTWRRFSREWNRPAIIGAKLRALA